MNLPRHPALLSGSRDEFWFHRPGYPCHVILPQSAGSRLPLPGYRLTRGPSPSNSVPSVPACVVFPTGRPAWFYSHARSSSASCRRSSPRRSSPSRARIAPPRVSVPTDPPEKPSPPGASSHQMIRMQMYSTSCRAGPLLPLFKCLVWEPSSHVCVPVTPSPCVNQSWSDPCSELRGNAVGQGSPCWLRSRTHLWVMQGPAQPSQPHCRVCANRDGNNVNINPMRAPQPRFALLAHGRS